MSRGLNADLRRSCDSFIHWRWRLAGEQHLDGLTANFSPHEPNSDRLLPSNGLRYTTVALATKLGMRPLVARCHAGLAKVYRRKDKRQQADEHFATATTMYHDMGMTYWLEKAERLMRGLG